VARVVLPFAVLWCVFWPQREAKALLPFLVPIAVAGLDAAGSVVVADMIGAAATALIGGTIVALAITPKDAGTGSDLVPIRVATTTGAGSTSVMAPSGSAPSSGTVTVTYSFSGGGKTGTASNITDACTSLAAQLGFSPGFIDSGRCYWTLAGGVWGGGVLPTGPVNTCSPGYTLAAGPVCNLTDLRAAAQDGRQDVTRSGTTMTKATEADSSPAPSATQTTTTTNDTLVVSGKDSSGRPVRVSVQATSDGGSLMTVSTQKTDANGGTYTDNRITQIASDGTVRSGANTSTGQQVVYNPTTGVYDLATATSTANPATAGSGSTSITFPSDYARAGEAVSAANVITAVLGPKLDAITATGADPTELTIAPGSEFDQAFFQGTFSNLLGWQLPAHSSQCPTSSFTWNGGSYTINSHCQLIADHFSTLAGAMSAVWTILALLIVLGA
jgi:hypothetical protein